MKKSILLFLKGEALKTPAANYFDLHGYLLRIFPASNPREVKSVLLEMEREGLAAFSGSWTTLGATYGGVVQGLKECTIHAALLPKGAEEAQRLSVAPVATPVTATPVAATPAVPPPTVIDGPYAKPAAENIAPQGPVQSPPPEQAAVMPPPVAPTTPPITNNQNN